MRLDLDLTPGFRRQRRSKAGYAVMRGRIILKALMAVATLIAAVYVWRGLRDR